MDTLELIPLLPEAIKTCSATSLWQHCQPLSLFRIHGKNKFPLFISIVLHGNENGGLIALQKLFKKYPKELPREVILLVGNTLAARKECRRLDSQPDFNRIWSGNNSAEGIKALKILSILEKVKPIASVDIHNNTGRNPYFICLNKKAKDFFELAQIFEATTIYFEEPSEVLAIACAKFSPSVTIESGLPNDEAGAIKTSKFIEQLLITDSWKNKNMNSFSYFEVQATIKVPHGITFSIGDENTNLCLNPSLDTYNFVEMTQNIPFASYNEYPASDVIQIIDNNNNMVFEKYIHINKNKLYFKPGTTPSMLTIDKKVISQDCLGYLMKRKLIKF